MNYNLTLLGGNITRDIELRTLENGTKVANFSIAVNSSFKKDDGTEVKNVDFFQIEVWAKQAESCAQYLHKGSSVFVIGRLKTDKWEKDGVKHSKVKVVASQVKFLGGKPKDQTQAGPKSETEQDEDNSSIPF